MQVTQRSIPRLTNGLKTIASRAKLQYLTTLRSSSPWANASKPRPAGQHLPSQAGLTLGLTLSAGLTYYLTSRSPAVKCDSPATDNAIRFQSDDEAAITRDIIQRLASPDLETAKKAAEAYLLHHFPPERGFTVSRTGPLVGEPVPLQGGGTLHPAQTACFVVEALDINPTRPSEGPMAVIQAVIFHVHHETADGKEFLYPMVHWLDTLDGQGLLGERTFASILLSKSYILLQYCGENERLRTEVVSHGMVRSSEGLPSTNPQSRKKLFALKTEASGLDAWGGG